MQLQKIGEIIKKRRKFLNVNQMDICEIADISQHTLSDIENGKSNPTVESLTKILDILGMEIDIKIKDR